MPTFSKRTKIWRAFRAAALGERTSHDAGKRVQRRCHAAFPMYRAACRRAILASSPARSYKVAASQNAFPMIVTCPDCTTRYLVDPRALGSAGRVVRCAHCSKPWHQAPPEDCPRSLDMPLADAAPPLVGSRPQLPALPRRRGVPLATAVWMALLAIILASVVGAVIARDQIVVLWPPAARLYAMVGLPAAPARLGLDLRKVMPSRGIGNGVAMLIIEGQVANVSQVAHQVPKLNVV